MPNIAKGSLEGRSTVNDLKSDLLKLNLEDIENKHFWSYTAKK